MWRFLYKLLQKWPQSQVVVPCKTSASWKWEYFFPWRHIQQPHRCVCRGPIFVLHADSSYHCEFCRGVGRRSRDGPSPLQTTRGRVLITPGLSLTEAARDAGNAILTHLEVTQTSLSALAGRMTIAQRASQRSLESYTEWCGRVICVRDTQISCNVCNSSHTSKYNQEEVLGESVQNALYGLRFAMASYALPYELGYFSTAMRRIQLWMPGHHRYAQASTADQVLSVRRILCGERDDPLLEVAYARYSNSLWQPCFVVILDHHTQRIVVAFRGTLSAADLIADVAVGYTKAHIATYRDTSTGKMEELYTQIPSGFYTSVMEAGTHLTQVLDDIRRQYPMYKLLCVGHSFGAVEAILFHLIFLFPTHTEGNNVNNDNVHTIAFGPAPCVEQAVVAKISALMGPHALTSWVYGLDAVPRLQVRSVHGLFYPPSSYTNPNTTSNSTSASGMGVPLLAIPGRVLHVPDGTTSVVEVPLDAPWRQQVVLGKRMLQDHLPGAYTTALYRVMAEWEGCRGERSGKKELG